MMRKWKEQDEVHMKGLLSIEKDLKRWGGYADLGIQIAHDGRVWICIDGEAVIRFNPKVKELFTKKGIYDA